MILLLEQVSLLIVCFVVSFLVLLSLLNLLSSCIESIFFLVSVISREVFYCRGCFFIVTAGV